MKYEEFVSLHPKLINWNQSWEFIFKYTKPLFDKYNNEWFYRWLAENASKWDLWYVWSDYKELKNNWRVIQKYLTYGYRLCYECGTILNNKFRSHLSKHNLTTEDWYCKYNNILKYKHYCKICNKELDFDFKQYKYPNYCIKCSKIPGGSIGGKRSVELYGDSRSPSSWTEIQIKNRGFSGSKDLNYLILLNKEKLSNSIAGRCGGIKSFELYGDRRHPHLWNEIQIINNGYFNDTDPNYIKLCESYHTHHKLLGHKNYLKYGDRRNPSTWTDEQIKNRGYCGRTDSEFIKLLDWQFNKNSYAGKLGSQKVQLIYGCKFPSKSYKTLFNYSDKEYKLDSQYELWTLLYILVFYKDEDLLDTQHYYKNDMEYYNSKGALADIRTKNKVNGVITNWEVHDLNDVDSIDRKKFCTELHNEKFSLVSLETADNYYWELLELNYNVDKIYKDLEYCNKINKMPLKLNFSELTITN